MRMPLQSFAWVLLPLLLVACGGGDDSGGETLSHVATITVSPSNASIVVAQTQTIKAEARDQNGVVMTGVSFTWTSSNSSVAVVIDGVATAVAAGITGITASSGGVTSNSTALTVAVSSTSSVVIDTPAVFFPATGQSAQLTAQFLDPLGASSAGTVTWSSSSPDKVSVDGSGRLVALAIGSAQIFAEAAGVRSAPTLVFVAQPQPGALLVTDAQVVSVGPLLRLAAGASPGVGSQYEVTLRGVEAPTPGTVVLASETAPIAGKVVITRQETDGLVVTLALAPLYELFSAYDIRLDHRLSAFPLEAVPEKSAQATPSARVERGTGAGRRHASLIRPLDAFDSVQSL